MNFIKSFRKYLILRVTLDRIMREDRVGKIENIKF